MKMVLEIILFIYFHTASALKRQKEKIRNYW
jgi:hypothetical protein